MRFSILMVAILAITVIYVSCNKHSIQKSSDNFNQFVNGWEHTSNPESRTHLTFDENRNIVEEETSHDISTYEFIKDSVFIREFSKTERRDVYEFRGKLDNLKRLVSGTAASSYISSSPDTVLHQFEYNKEGHVVSETRLSGLADTFLMRYQYEEDVLKRVYTYDNSILNNIKEFTYYPKALAYGLPEQTKFRKNINNLVGSSQQRLVKQIISTGRNGKKRYISTYEYRMDTRGYPDKMMSRKGKKLSSVMTYFYSPVPNEPNVLIAAD